MTIARRWLRSLNERRLPEAHHLLAEDIASSCPDWPDDEYESFGPLAVLGLVGGWFNSFPDLRFEMTRVSGSGRRAFVEGFIHGTTGGDVETPDGEVLPRGRMVSYPFSAIVETRGREMVAFRIRYDLLDILSQLRQPA